MALPQFELRKPWYIQAEIIKYSTDARTDKTKCTITLKQLLIVLWVIGSVEKKDIMGVPA
jgi:hypothetical protein